MPTSNSSSGGSAIGNGSSLKGLLATLAPPVGSADPEVQAAVALGWHLSEFWLIEPASIKTPAAVTSPDWPPPKLKDLGQLDHGAIQQIVLAGIRADLENLKSITLPDPGLLAAGAARSGPTKPNNPASGQDPVDAFHVGCLAGLMAHEPALADAYLVGVDLGDTVLRSYKLSLKDPGATRASLKKLLTERGPGLARRIKELKDGLGDYVGDSVAAAIEDWRQWASLEYAVPAGQTALSDEELRDLFYRQGSVWRTLLTGERQAGSYLALREYLKAALAMIDDYGRLALSLASRPFSLALVASLAAVVILVAGVSASSNSGPLGTIIAALSAFGFTGTSLVAGLKRLLDEADAILWHAEVAAAVALATNVLPSQVARDSSNRIGLKVAIGG